jgi:plastocyanin
VSRVSRSSTALLVVGAVCLAAAWLASCSKSSPTKPTTTGGGGVGGTTAELGGNLGPNGGTYAHAFSTAGTFNYHCTIHPGCGGLAGTIVVVPVATTIQNRTLAISQSGGSSGIYGSTCSALSLSRDTVHVGDTVTWTNNSPFSHNVVSQ